MTNLAQIANNHSLSYETGLTFNKLFLYQLLTYGTGLIKTHHLLFLFMFVYQLSKRCVRKKV
jgi:hypothetical protein